MNKSLFLSLFISLCLGGISTSSTYAAPIFGTNEEINFGPVLFITGNCTMNHINGSFSDVNPAVMCGVGGRGTPGRYVIITDPNKQVQIEILQRDNQGDGILFIPQGELISDTETHTITPGIAQEIDSGASGVVNIHLGGRLFILSYQNPSSNIEVTLIDGIEWSVLP